jgi:hypothetical protein
VTLLTTCSKPRWFRTLRQGISSAGRRYSGRSGPWLAIHASCDMHALGFDRTPWAQTREGKDGDRLRRPSQDRSHEELTVRVLPRQSDEFTCAGCFLVRHRSQIAEERPNGDAYCYDCAG